MISDNEIKIKLIDKFEFKNQYANDVCLELLIYADKHINRLYGINTLKKYIKWELFVDYIEKGLFEYSIIFIHINTLPIYMVVNVYTDKLNDICKNLDTNDTLINNQTLKLSILNFEIKAYYIAFLSPEQIHPIRWSDIIRKRTTREDIENNFSTTDLYRCWKCGERKGRITQKQVRCPDEPITTFIQCMVCLTTFTK